MLLAKQIVPVLIHILKNLDPEAFKPLQPYRDSIICLQIENFSVLYLRIQENGLQVVALAEGDIITTTFAGPLGAFSNLLFTKHHTMSIPLQIAGDLDCAQAFNTFWQDLDLDWEGSLAKVVGDNVAHTLWQGFSESKIWLQKTLQARQEDIGAYLQDEIELLPTPHEVEDLFKDIDHLRNDVERFAAKLNLYLERDGSLPSRKM